MDYKIKGDRSVNEWGDIGLLLLEITISERNNDRSYIIGIILMMALFFIKCCFLSYPELERRFTANDFI